MHARAFSTFSAIAEIFVTSCVLYVVLQNYRQRGYAATLAALVIVFEFSVNMLYIIFRMRESSAHHDATVGAPSAQRNECQMCADQ